MITLSHDHEEIFRNLWEAAQSNDKDYRFDFRSLAKIMKPNLTDEMFDHGLQHCNFTDTDYEHAKSEFLLIVNQTF
jgi:hypothetical protein